MLSFVEKGIDFQYNATTVNMAERAFNTSCNICASTGKHINCAMCKISAAHEAVMFILKRKPN